jgi:hypothetical protein
MDFPPGDAHRDYAAMVDGSGLRAGCCCSHSIGDRQPLVECSRNRLYQLIQVKTVRAAL